MSSRLTIFLFLGTLLPGAFLLTVVPAPVCIYLLYSAPAHMSEFTVVFSQFKEVAIPGYLLLAFVLGTAMNSPRAREVETVSRKVVNWKLWLREAVPAFVRRRLRSPAEGDCGDESPYWNSVQKEFGSSSNMLMRQLMDVGIHDGTGSSRIFFRHCYLYVVGRSVHLAERLRHAEALHAFMAGIYRCLFLASATWVVSGLTLFERESGWLFIGGGLGFYACSMLVALGFRHSHREYVIEVWEFYRFLREEEGIGVRWREGTGSESSPV